MANELYNSDMKKYTFPYRLLTILTGALLALLLAAACSASPAATLAPSSEAPAAATTTSNPTGAYWPTADWRTSTPAEQGMDAEKLSAALEKAQKSMTGLHSLLVIRHGYLVQENYFSSYKQDTLHTQYSVSKSFISTLVGIAIDQGLIAGVDENVLGYFPGQTFDNPEARKETMTLEHLLSMTSGLGWVEGDPAYRAMYVSQDWAAYVLDLPMVATPGEVFNYCSGCSHVLATVLDSALGKSALEKSGLPDFARRNLFAPLGIQKYTWETDSQGIPIGGWGLNLRPRDMAKLGYLYLHQGQWDGQQVISSAWVTTATSKHIQVEGATEYGYQWWIYPELGGYAALGLGGQTIFVSPQRDLIVVTTADLDGHDKIFQLIEKYILPAVSE